MIIKGIDITDAQVAACIERMKTGYFKARQIARTAMDAGVPVGPYGGVPDRLADRLIQREKKAGNIELRPGCKWKWIATLGEVVR